MNYADTLEHNASVRRGAKMPKATLSHVRMEETNSGGHIVESHFNSPGAYKEPVKEAFEKPVGKPQIPKGHVLQHIAKQMNIPHDIVDEPLKEEDEG